MKEEALDLGDFLYIIRKRIKLILLIIALSTLSSIILNYCIIKPTYEAKAMIVVGKINVNLNDKSKSDYDDVMMFQKLIKTYAEIGKSETVLENASAKLRNISTKELLDNITVTPEEDTQLIEFKAQNHNSKEAYRMLNAVCNSFMQEAKRVYAGQNIQIMDKAEIPKKPIKPKKFFNICITFFLGLVFSLGISFLLEYMDNTLKTEQDINKYLGLPVIGVVPKVTDKY